MQTTISFTDQDDKVAVSDLLLRIASALSSTPGEAVLSHVHDVDQGSTSGETPVSVAPKRTRTSKKPDPVETYNALAAAAGAPAVVVEPTAPIAAVEPAPAITSVAAPAADTKPAEAPAAVLAGPEPQDRKALEASVLAALNRAGMAWARANWPAGKALRLGDFTDEELLALRAKAEKNDADEIPL